MDLLNILFGVACWLGLSAAVAISEHPRNGADFWAKFLRVLGRVSCLRHGDGPGTLHLPLFRQPWWPPAGEPPEVRYRVVSGTMGTIAMLLLVVVSGCIRREAPTVLQDALVAQTRALQDWVGWDGKHQQDLVHGAKTRPEAELRLKDYRAARAELLQQLRLAADVVRAAVALLDPVPPAVPPTATPSPPTSGGGR